MQINPAALTAIRERTGFSKAQFAAAVGISPSYLTEIEKGDKTGVKPDVIRRMADVLKVDIAAIIRDPQRTPA